MRIPKSGNGVEPAVLKDEFILEIVFIPWCLLLNLRIEEFLVEVLFSFKFE